MHALLLLDGAIVEQVASARTPLGVLLSYVASGLGSTATIGALSLVFVVYLAHKHRYLVIPCIITILGAMASFEILKELIARARPPEVLALYAAPLYSFPSGHATMAVAFYGFAAYALAHRLPRHLRHWCYLAALALALLIGASRVYLGVHYPSDVLAGYLLGGLWLFFGIMIAKRSSRP